MDRYTTPPRVRLEDNFVEEAKKCTPAFLDIDFKWAVSGEFITWRRISSDRTLSQIRSIIGSSIPRDLPGKFVLTKENEVWKEASLIHV
jgi:hypothetical protein